MALSVAALPAQQAADNVTPCSCATVRPCGARWRTSRAARSTFGYQRDNQRRLPIGEVALIRPRRWRQRAARDGACARHAAASTLAILTSGASVTGKLVDIAGGPGSAAGEEGKERRYIFLLPDGSQRSVPGNDVGRVYLGSYSLAGQRRRRTRDRGAGAGRRDSRAGQRPVDPDRVQGPARVSGSASTSVARSVSRSTRRTWPRRRAARAWRPRPKCRTLRPGRSSGESVRTAFRSQSATCPRSRCRTAARST